MDKKTLIQEAEAAERETAREALQPPRATVADLADVMEVDAVDQYVAATGDYPISGDIAGPDVVEDGLLVDASLSNEKIEVHETAEERAARHRDSG
jgi:hypothetical protein